MIKVEAVYIGDQTSSFVQKGFSDGVNIINSDDNHVGKTIVMQSMMYVLGYDAMFPKSFDSKQYYFIVDLKIDGQPISVLRHKDTFVVIDNGAVIPLEAKRDFDEYWNNKISPLPVIVKDARSKQVGLSLYTQMAFLPQTDRDTASVYGSYFKKDDFEEMIYVLANLGIREASDESEKQLKEKKDALKTRARELEKQGRVLKSVGSSLAAISPTADREETARHIKRLDELGERIGELQRQRNSEYTRKLKNEQVLKELNSLNREMKERSVVCLKCGSDAIGYKMPESEYVFDVTTQSMRAQIRQAVQDRIDKHADEYLRLGKEIRKLQSQFSEMAKTKEITLEDIYSIDTNYGDLEAIDYKLTSINEELEDIKQKLETKKKHNKELQEERREYMDGILATMTMIRQVINDGEEVASYESLFTTMNRQYSGSEVTEFLLARIYSLALHVGYKLPIIIDSFRAEELSTRREENVLPYFEKLENQVIFSATLKGPEAGKYHSCENINDIDYSSHEKNHLLTSAYNEEFANKLSEFGLLALESNL